MATKGGRFKRSARYPACEVCGIRRYKHRVTVAGEEYRVCDVCVWDLTEDAMIDDGGAANG